MIPLRPTKLKCADCGNPLDWAELPGRVCPCCQLHPLCAVCAVIHEEGGNRRPEEFVGEGYPDGR